MRFIIAFIVIFVWTGACSPTKKHRKRYPRADYSERYHIKSRIKSKHYDKKSQKKSARATQKKHPKVQISPPVISNPSLLPTILNTKDQTIMILIDQGKYLVGVKNMNQQRTSSLSEKSSQLVSISAFYIDRTETTVTNFQKFQPEYTEKTYTEGKPCPQCPAMGITWYQAQKYCQWAGKRLPTENEWEAAARGNSNFNWPWGNEHHPQHANTLGKEDGFLFVAPVASFPKGASPFGLMDMTGNVWEWVMGENNGLKIVKGGGWTSYGNQSKISSRNTANPKLKNPTFGFRCAAKRQR